MPESAPLIGLGAGGRTVSVDLDHDSPHVLISAGTGGGKSTILRTIACQFLHNGARAHILDFKRISHTWARGIPGVTYCRDIADIHDALLHLGEQGRYRIRIAEELGDDVLAENPERVGPRIVILLEEINATMAQLKRHWEKTRGPGDPKTSPAIDALAEILFMGRQVRLHVLLVPEVHPAPKPTRHPGRVQVVLGGTARETQVLNLSETQARAWAMTGTPGNESPLTLLKTPIPPPDHDPDPAPEHARPGEEEGVGLREAQSGLPGVTLAGLCWARANDPDFPAHTGRRGREHLYRLDDLQQWARNRPRAAG